MDEFSLIRQYFTRASRQREVQLGVGDDAALWRPRAGFDLAIAADMLLADRHFFADDPPDAIGAKALAVNISDMAAMGAQPRAVTLCLALPQAQSGWLSEFARGFWAMADQYGIDLIGGDTTRGPLTIAIQIWGEVEPGRALRRSGARPGDDVWVSGELGLAALGLQQRLGQMDLPEALAARCIERLQRPQPRVALGRALQSLASAAIDVSDGLLSDLGHLLQASGCGAELHWQSLLSDPLLRKRADDQRVRECVLAGGDDYELCFTAPVLHRDNVRQLANTLDLPLTHIGTVSAGSGITIKGESGEHIHIGRSGYNHFAGADS